jgi:hypothetical protein
MEVETDNIDSIAAPPIGFTDGTFKAVINALDVTLTDNFLYRVNIDNTTH